MGRKFCILVLAALSGIFCKKNNPAGPGDSGPFFPHTYHGTAAYFAGDTLGTIFGVWFTAVSISKADSIFTASTIDSLPQNNAYLIDTYQIQSTLDQSQKLQYSVTLSDGSNGIAIFNATQDSLVMIFQTFLTTQYGTPYERIYKVAR
jgi:hypothetical protein